MPAHGFAALHPALGDPSLCGTLALDGVRSAIGDPFLERLPSPHRSSRKNPCVAEVAKDAMDALVLRSHGIAQDDVTEAAESYAYSSRVA
jgi:hypothetical protein